MNDGWRPPQPSGYLESIQAIGGFAAPLLAGASFALAVLGLQSSTPPATPYSRWPDASLAFFLAAGLAQIGTVQATAWTRRYMCTPAELAEWYPDRLVNGEPSQWLYNVQHSQMRQALRWADVARGFFHIGLMALIAGVIAACVPPGHISAGRWTVVALAVAGLLGESAWLLRAIFLDRALRRQAWLHAPVLVVAVAAPAAGFAGALRGWAAAALLAGAVAYAVAAALSAMTARRRAAGGSGGSSPRASAAGGSGGSSPRASTALIAASGCAIAGGILLVVTDLPVVVLIAALPVVVVAAVNLVSLARKQRALRAR